MSSTIKLFVKRFKIGDLTVPEYGPMFLTGKGFKLSIRSEGSEIHLAVLFEHVKKCLVGKWKHGLVCLELTPECASDISSQIQAEFPNCVFRLLPNDSQIAVKYIILSLDPFSQHMVSLLRNAFDPFGPSVYRELSQLCLDLILSDFLRDVIMLHAEPKLRSDLRSSSPRKSDKGKQKNSKEPVVVINKISLPALPGLSCTSTTNESTGRRTYTSCNVKDKKAIEKILGYKYAKIRLKRVNETEPKVVTAKRSKTTDHEPIAKINLDPEPSQDLDQESFEELVVLNAGAFSVGQYKVLREPAISINLDPEPSQDLDQDSFEEPVVLNAGAFSVGQYKGIGLSSLELGADHVSLRFSAQTTLVQSLGGGLRLATAHVQHVSAHVSDEHTSVLFLYLAPPAIALMASFLQSKSEFLGYRRPDTFNSCGVLAVVLQPISEQLAARLRSLCAHVARSRGQGRQGSLLHEIDAESAGKHLKVCFSSNISEALITTSDRITILPHLPQPVDSLSSTTSQAAEQSGESEASTNQMNQSLSRSSQPSSMTDQSHFIRTQIGASTIEIDMEQNSTTGPSVVSISDSIHVNNQSNKSLNMLADGAPVSITPRTITPISEDPPESSNSPLGKDNDREGINSLLASLQALNADINRGISVPTTNQSEPWVSVNSVSNSSTLNSNPLNRNSPSTTKDVTSQVSEKATITIDDFGSLEFNSVKPSLACNGSAYGVVSSSNSTSVTSPPVPVSNTNSTLTAPKYTYDTVLDDVIYQFTSRNDAREQAPSTISPETMLISMSALARKQSKPVPSLPSTSISNDAQPTNKESLSASGIRIESAINKYVETISDVPSTGSAIMSSRIRQSPISTTTNASGKPSAYLLAQLREKILSSANSRPAVSSNMMPSFTQSPVSSVSAVMSSHTIYHYPPSVTSPVASNVTSSLSPNMASSVSHSVTSPILPKVTSYAPQSVTSSVSHNMTLAHVTPRPVMTSQLASNMPAEAEIRPIVIEPEDEEVPALQRCPFSLRPIQQPVRNIYCRHVYDLESVTKALLEKPVLHCPVIGCTNTNAVTLQQTLDTSAHSAICSSGETDALG